MSGHLMHAWVEPLSRTQARLRCNLCDAVLATFDACDLAYAGTTYRRHACQPAPAPAVPVGVQPEPAERLGRAEQDADQNASMAWVERQIEAIDPAVPVVHADFASGKVDPEPGDAEWRLRTWRQATHPYYATSGMALADVEVAAAVAAVRADVLALADTSPKMGDWGWRNAIRETLKDPS